MAKIITSRKKDRYEVIYKLGKEESLNEMELDIVSKQEIPFLIPSSFSSGMMGQRIIARVDSYTELRRYLSQGIGFDAFLTCVRQVIRAVQECESHGVRSQNLDLNMEYCFVDPATSEVRLCFWPVLTLEEYSDLKKFLQEMVSFYYPKATEQELFAEYKSIFTIREKFDTHWFLNQLDQRFSNKKKATAKEASKTVNPIHQTLLPSFLESIRGNRKNSSCAVLYRAKTGSNIPLLSFPITLGRSSEDCGCVVPDNMYIGSRHITFFKYEEKYYVRDEGARNGSVIDGYLLEKNKEAEIHDGSILTLGGEEFVFLTKAK